MKDGYSLLTSDEQWKYLRISPCIYTKRLYSIPRDLTFLP